MTTDYTNAPAPHSALFDDAPAAAPVPAPAHVTPATRISQDRAGKWYRMDVFMQYGAPIPLDLALTRVAFGRTVFVAREDGEAVLAAARGTGGETSTV